MPTNPNQTLENALVKAGFTVACAWQRRGSDSDGWAWIECLLVNGMPVIVQTYKLGGWEAYIPAHAGNSIELTIKAVIDRLAEL